MICAAGLFLAAPSLLCHGQSGQTELRRAADASERLSRTADLEQSYKLAPLPVEGTADRNFVSEPKGSPRVDGNSRIAPLQASTQKPKQRKPGKISITKLFGKQVLGMGVPFYGGALLGGLLLGGLGIMAGGIFGAVAGMYLTRKYWLTPAERRRAN